jgi:periplasmic protein TonB
MPKPNLPYPCTHWLLAACMAAIIMTGCATHHAPLPPVAVPPIMRPNPVDAPLPSAPTDPEPQAPTDHNTAQPGVQPAVLSEARTLYEYKKQVATRLYEQNAHRIYKGKLPPLLYAVGVLQVQIGTTGQVEYLHWLRAPTHAPEVMAEVERSVKAAAPYPAPVYLGPTLITDTWLWHKSGKFQLDTLTEGQR